MGVCYDTKWGIFSEWLEITIDFPLWGGEISLAATGTFGLLSLVAKKSSNSIAISRVDRVLVILLDSIAVVSSVSSTSTSVSQLQSSHSLAPHDEVFVSLWQAIGSALFAVQQLCSTSNDVDDLLSAEQLQR